MPSDSVLSRGDGQCECGHAAHPESPGRCPVVTCLCPFYLPAAGKSGKPPMSHLLMTEAEIEERLAYEGEDFQMSALAFSLAHTALAALREAGQYEQVGWWVRRDNGWVFRVYVDGREFDTEAIPLYRKITEGNQG